MSQITARRDSHPNSVDHAGNRRPVLIFVGVLITIVLTSYGIRIATDTPFLISGAAPEPEDFESRYVAHPWLAYLHMATAVFSCWFVACLALAVNAIRRGDAINHRRWMIRAFATGAAVGTVRIWLGLLFGSGLLDAHNSFDAAFWIAFSLHVIAGEWWIRTTPAKSG